MQMLFFPQINMSSLQKSTINYNLSYNIFLKFKSSKQPPNLTQTSKSALQFHLSSN